MNPSRVLVNRATLRGSIRAALQLWLLAVTGIHLAGDERIDFFERKIRPVLVEQCYRCHSAGASAAGKLRGGLQLDSRAGIRKGGDSGPAVVPGSPGESLLLKALRHEGVLD